MPLYNVYAGTGQGGRMARIYSFTAGNDEAAKEIVVDRLTDKPVELWCFSKRVARFEGKPAPKTA